MSAEFKGGDNAEGPRKRVDYPATIYDNVTPSEWSIVLGSPQRPTIGSKEDPAFPHIRGASRERKIKEELQDRADKRERDRDNRRKDTADRVTSHLMQKTGKGRGTPERLAMYAKKVRTDLDATQNHLEIMIARERNKLLSENPHPTDDTMLEAERAAEQSVLDSVGQMVGSTDHLNLGYGVKNVSRDNMAEALFTSAIADQEGFRTRAEALVEEDQSQALITGVDLVYTGTRGDHILNGEQEDADWRRIRGVIGGDTQDPYVVRRPDGNGYYVDHEQEAKDENAIEEFSDALDSWDPQQDSSSPQVTGDSVELDTGIHEILPPPNIPPEDIDPAQAFADDEPEPPTSVQEPITEDPALAFGLPDDETPTSPETRIFDSPDGPTSQDPPQIDPIGPGQGGPTTRDEQDISDKRNDDRQTRDGYDDER